MEVKFESGWRAWKSGKRKLIERSREKRWSIQMLYKSKERKWNNKVEKVTWESSEWECKESNEMGIVISLLCIKCKASSNHDSEKMTTIDNVWNRRVEWA